MLRRDEETERDWQASLAEATPEEILQWAGETFGAESITLACSFGGLSGMVLLELTRKILPEAPVFTLDTGFLFPETHALREEAAARYGFTPLVMKPTSDDVTPGPKLPSTDACCAARKVEPTGRALAGKAAWIAGLRRDQSKTRAAVPPVAWDDEFGLYKIAPLWRWSEEECQSYIAAQDIPVNALHSQGYPSIGCWPCTRAVKPGEDARAGRWEGEEKTECGLHLKIPPPRGAGSNS